MHDFRESIDRYFYIGGFNCAETTLTVLRESGLVHIEPVTTKLMTGFGGGMAKGYVCGSVIAAVAALGDRYGRTSPEQDRGNRNARYSNISLDSDSATIRCNAPTSSASTRPRRNRNTPIVEKSYGPHLRHSAKPSRKKRCHAATANQSSGFQWKRP